MWLFFTIATTLLWSFAELFYKRGAKPDEDYAQLKTCICVGAVMGVHAFITIFTADFRYDPVNLLRYLPVSFLYILSMALSFFGMRFVEESISDPIENTSGALCTLLCVLFLGETLEPFNIAAVIIILAGILGIGFLESGKRRLTGGKAALIAFSMPFLYAILDALGSFLDIFYLDDPALSPLVNVDAGNIELMANISYELTFFICAVIFSVFLAVKKEKFGFRNQGDKILAAFCETGGQLTYVYAMSGNGALAAPVISGVCVFSLLLSRIFLREKLTKKQYLFIFIVLAGIMMLAVSEG